MTDAIENEIVVPLTGPATVRRSPNGAYFLALSRGHAADLVDALARSAGCLVIRDPAPKPPPKPKAPPPAKRARASAAPPKRRA